jgi:hypothetical protein
MMAQERRDRGHFAEGADLAGRRKAGAFLA